METAKDMLAFFFMMLCRNPGLMGQVYIAGFETIYSFQLFAENLIHSLARATGTKLKDGLMTL